MNEGNVCRICMLSQETLISLFSKRHGISVYESLSIKLKIDVSSFGPSFICSQCLSELDITLQFLEKCEKSNKIVLASYKRMKSGESPEKSASVSIHNSCYKLSKQHDLDDLGEEEEASKVIDTNETNRSNRSCTECGPQHNCKHQHILTSLICPYCHKGFTRKYNYNMHLKRHLGKYEWPCPMCGVLKLTPRQAKSHCAPHRQCPVPGCGKTFTSNVNLASHVRRHNGERPFECADCGKTFTCKNTLTDHIRIHTGVKPYICPVCGKRFTTNKLTAHLRTHSDARPFACPMTDCTRTFRSSRAARLHAHTHAHGSRRVLSCPLCPARYSHSQSLNKHMKRQHGNVQKQTSTGDGICIQR